MRILHLYLVGYFVVILGAVLALWKAGILVRIPGVWLAIAAVIVVGLGLLAAVTATRPTIVSRE